MNIRKLFLLVSLFIVPELFAVPVVEVEIVGYGKTIAKPVSSGLDRGQESSATLLSGTLRVAEKNLEFQFHPRVVGGQVEMDVGISCKKMTGMLEIRGHGAGDGNTVNVPMWTDRNIQFKTTCDFEKAVVIGWDEESGLQSAEMIVRHVDLPLATCVPSQSVTGERPPNP